MSVDLPAPFSPMSECTSPGKTRKRTSSSAVSAPNLTAVATSPAGAVVTYTVAGSDDQVNVSGIGWTQLETNHTNANLPGHTFVHYHNSTTNSDLYIDVETTPSIPVLPLLAVTDSAPIVRPEKPCSSAT